ncbi:MAG TPA: DUF2971 domain-containing protein [Chlorobaculum sp.]|nr:DUF2971 domain-containing protein [Chlorobaculum sp.]
MELLYKFKPAEPLAHIVDILLEHRLYCANYTELNDPFEGQFITEFRDSPEMRAIFASITGLSLLTIPTNKLVRSLKDITELPLTATANRICSLTSCPVDVRLWSHYASGHTGLAFELNTDGLNPPAREVIYASNIMKGGTGLLGAPTAEDVLTRKTDHWEYEQEYRIVTNETYVSVSGRITRIILGARASDTLERLVRRLVDVNIEVTKAELDVEGIQIP